MERQATHSLGNGDVLRVVSVPQSARVWLDALASALKMTRSGLAERLETVPCLLPLPCSPTNPSDHLLTTSLFPNASHCTPNPVAHEHLPATLLQTAIGEARRTLAVRQEGGLKRTFWGVGAVRVSGISGQQDKRSSGSEGELQAGRKQASRCSGRCSPRVLWSRCR